MAGSSWVAWLLLAAALLAGGFLAGHDVAGRSAAKAQTATAAELAVWQTSAMASDGALKDLAERLRKQRDELHHLRAIADAAMAKRDAANRATQRLREQLKQALLKDAHEDPECADLARPLCPAVAGRLFHPAGGDPAPAH